MTKGQKEWIESCPIGDRREVEWCGLKFVVDRRVAGSDNDENHSCIWRSKFQKVKLYLIDAIDNCEKLWLALDGISVYPTEDIKELRHVAIVNSLRLRTYKNIKVSEVND